MLERTPKHKSEKFPVGLNISPGRKFQNPPNVTGSGMPTHKKHRLGDTDGGIGAGTTRYNPKGK